MTERRHTLRLLALLAFAAALLLALPAFAQEAEDISAACDYAASDKTKLFRVYDGKTKMPFEGKKNKENWIEVDTPSGKTAEALYFVWKADTSPVSLERWNGKQYEPYLTVNTGDMVHEYVRVDGLSKFRLRSTDSAGTIALCEMTVLTAGDPPAWVQAWEKPCEDADILILVAHPDDEYLFFGGAIPWYTQEKGLHVAVAYMTLQNETRLHELLDGLWTAGIREYPYVLGFFDKLCSKVATAYKYWGEEESLDAVAKLIDTTHARVVLTQDAQGEYGHGGHMAVADLCLRIIRDGERQLTSRPQKLYLHLWKENPIVMDWLTPMHTGQTSLDAAAAAFKCHKSQQGFSAKMRNGKEYKFEVKSGGPLDNAKFGLAFTSVGEDEACNDFMEHVTR